MSDGNRGRNYALGFLAGSILALSVGYSFWSDATGLESQIRLQAQEHAEQYANPASVSIEHKAPNISSPRQDNCISTEEDSANEAERGTYDLEAQQIMANWTRVMGKAAIVGMGVGILGLFLIFITFWETRKAAVAGRKANDITRDLQRARIVPVTKFEAIPYGKDQFIIGCENIGTTPAFNLRCAIQVVIGIPTIPPPLTDWGKPRLVKPQGEADLTYAEGEVLESTVIGCIEYDTIFEKARKTYICMTFEQSNMSKQWFAVDSRPKSWPEDT